MAHHFKGLLITYLLAKFHYSNINSVRDIVKKLKKCHFPKFQVNPVTLTFGQGQPMAYHFKGLLTNYLWAKFHNSAVNSVRDIVHVKVCDGRTVGRTDAGGSLHRLTLFTHVSQKLPPHFACSSLTAKVAHAQSEISYHFYF